MNHTTPGINDSRKTNMKSRFTFGVSLAVAAVVGLAACGDILTVSDPQRYTATDLDNALPAVANGVEGAVHEVIDSWVVYQNLLSDIYQHTGTWSGYDETDHGWFIYGANSMQGVMNSLLRARWFATAAEERFVEVLGAEAASSPLTAQARLGGALADMVIGMTWCEAPLVEDGPAVSDMDVLAQAVSKFTATISTANSAGASNIATAALAGRARAKLIMGDYAGAAADAAQVPDGFNYGAKFNNQSNNSIVTLTTATYNKAAGYQAKWWSLVDTDAAGPTHMRDPYTNEYDPRKPMYYVDGITATDNLTMHYSQWKFQVETDDIPMLHSDAMRLIQAENLYRTNDYAGAMTILNQLRANVGLTAIAVPTDATVMRDILLSERDAELFMEGMRAVDLYRFGLTKEIFAAMNDAERPASGRPTKWPMSETEALYNSNIVDDLAQRCLPVTN
jgi:hypothetical protein